MDTAAVVVVVATVVVAVAVVDTEAEAEAVDMVRCLPLIAPLVCSGNA